MSRSLPLLLLLLVWAVFAHGYHNVTAPDWDQRVVYTGGSWSNRSMEPIPELHNCSDGVSQTANLGAYLEFTFNGTAVYFNMVTDTVDRGVYSVIIDDAFVREINGSSATGPSCASVFGISGLPYRQHVLRITNLRPLNDSQPSILNADSFIYSLPDPSDITSSVVTATATTTATAGSQPSSGLSRASIIGVSVGGSVGAIVLLVILYLVLRRERLDDTESSSTESFVPPSDVPKAKTGSTAPSAPFDDRSRTLSSTGSPTRSTFSAIPPTAPRRGSPPRMSDSPPEYEPSIRT